MAAGLQHLHEIKVIHLDLKSRWGKHGGHSVLRGWKVGVAGSSGWASALRCYSPAGHPRPAGRARLVSPPLLLTRHPAALRSNILLAANGTAKISDVGLAKMLPISRDYIASAGATFGGRAWRDRASLVSLPAPSARRGNNKPAHSASATPVSRRTPAPTAPSAPPPPPRPP